MYLSVIGRTIAIFGLIAAGAILLIGDAKAAGPDQSDLIVKSIVLNNYKLFSRVDPSDLTSFSCTNSDFQNMIVCNKENVTKRLRQRLTITFDQNSKSLY